MISVYEKFGTKKHGEEFFEDNDNGEDFLLHDIENLLGFSQFMRLINKTV